MYPITIQAENHQSIPTRAHIDDAAYDIAANTHGEVLTIPPGETLMIPTGFKLGLTPGYEALITPRSSMGKKGILIPNSPGIVDAGYRGEVKVLLTNTSKAPFDIFDGDRIAQIRVKKVFQTNFVIGNVDEMPTERGTGGFGSSGK